MVKPLGVALPLSVALVAPIAVAGRVKTPGGGSTVSVAGSLIALPEELGVIVGPVSAVVNGDVSDDLSAEMEEPPVAPVIVVVAAP